MKIVASLASVQCQSAVRRAVAARRISKIADAGYLRSRVGSSDAQEDAQEAWQVHNVKVQLYIHAARCPERALGGCRSALKKLVASLASAPHPWHVIILCNVPLQHAISSACTYVTRSCDAYL